MLENKIVEMESQIATLKSHIDECKNALEQGEENEESDD